MINLGMTNLEILGFSLAAITIVLLILGIRDDKKQQQQPHPQI